jgi:DMSO/TMAO reductase YedYZ molybdopterin-dependent catalytic subunit
MGGVNAAVSITGRYMPDHGAPLRVYPAIKLGYKNVKYLTEINFLAHRTGGYW